MKRAIRYIAIGVFSALLMLGGVVWYLVSTTRGAASLLNWTTAASGTVLQWDALQGSLLDGLDAQGVSGSNGGTTWTLAELHLRWQPRLLLDERLVIDELTVRGLAIRSQSSAAGEPLTPETLRANLFGLPITIEVAQLRADDVTFVQGETRFAFQSLAGALNLDSDDLSVSSLDFRRDMLVVTGQASMTEALGLAGDVSWQLEQDDQPYAGALRLGGTLQQIEITHGLTSPVQLTSQGTLQPALFANELLGFDLQHEFPLQPLAVINRPDTTFAGSIHTTGSTGGGNFDTQVQLTGTVQNYPVALNGRISSRPSGTLDIDVDGSSGSNSLAVNGALGQTLELEWRVQAPALNELLPTLSGSLEGQGTVAGTRDMPEISGSLNGQQLGYQQEGSTLLLDTLAFTASYGAQGNDVQFQAGALSRTIGRRSTVLLESANVTLQGTPEQHTASATVVSAQGETQVDVRGAFVDGAWNGTLNTARLRSMQYGDWDLQDDVQLSYAQDAFTASRHCWDSAALLVCLSAGMSAERSLDLALTLEGLPLAWLNPNVASEDKPLALQQWQNEANLYLPDGVVASGVIDVELNTNDFSAPQNGTLDLVLKPQDVQLQWSPQNAEQLELLRQDLALTVKSSEVHLRQGVWSTAFDVDVAREQAGSYIPQGNVHAEGTLSDADVVDGTVVFDFTDLTWVETAVPELRDTAGTVNGLATVSGSRTDPHLQLQMQLSQGQFDIPEYGLQIREVDLQMTTASDESVHLTGTATSGPGSLSVDAQVESPLRSERHVMAMVKSDNLLAINTASAKSQLNTDLQLEYSAAQIGVTGSVEMFSADFNLEELFRSASEGAVPISNDVVIVRGAPEDEGVVNEQATLPISLDLAVKAGEGVHVYGYDLDATLAGEVSLRQSPGQSLLVYGELGIPRGSYRIYNQQLNAQDGRLMFFGNAANPVLDLRAFRTTPSAEVGVWLNGALSEVRGELYSTPALPDSEILSLLVTGKSFGDVNSTENDALLQAVTNFGLERSGGLTSRVGNSLGLDSFTLGGDSLDGSSALGLGKYLTPNLLMRYKVGLFDRQSVLGIEYTLNEHVKLKVESGISQSLELSYTIEKD